MTCWSTRKALWFGVSLVGAVALAPRPDPALAANSTATFTVSASVAPTCLITASTLAFGSYTGSRSDATSTISVTCTNTTPYNVGLDPGTAPGAHVRNRRMRGPGGTSLAYSMYQDSARTINWGETVGVDTKSGTGNGAVQALTVYGRIAAGQFVIPGAYVDTITATITY